MLQTVKNSNVGLGSESRMTEVWPALSEPKRPFALWQTALAFGIPSLAMAISFHWAMPTLQEMGLTSFESVVVAHVAPMALMLTAALAMVHEIDGYPLNWSVLRQRFRYPRLTWRAAGQGLGLFAVIFVAYGMFDMVSAQLVAQGLLPIPDGLPALLDPQVQLSTAVLDEMVGGQILGNWGVIVLYAIMLVFNIVSEELWWRGYILPRQEKRYASVEQSRNGRFTWVLHGILWTLFHAFKWWDLIGLLPVCLAIAYVSQRTKNNWPAFIAHSLFNGLAFFGIIVAVVTPIG
ncbi:MAG: CPBP family intramembrane metalloprotease [Chloroflexi bacterium]|nr:CPBP family intramembrane metalloprotease [Chloroflexota bacterium]